MTQSRSARKGWQKRLRDTVEKWEWKDRVIKILEYQSTENIALAATLEFWMQI